jgi:hypothetical protein
MEIRGHFLGLDSDAKTIASRRCGCGSPFALVIFGYGLLWCLISKVSWGCL